MLLYVQENTQLRRCHYSCFRANQELLGNLILPKINGGVHEIRCSVGAYNDETGEAHVYMELKEPVRKSKLETTIIGTGASQVIINTFSADKKGMKSMYDDECSAALFSVHKKSSEPGFVLISKGNAWVEPKEMTYTFEADQDLNTGGQNIDNEFSISHVREEAKRSRSIDAGDVLGFLMRQEKRQTMLEEHLATGNKEESEKTLSRYEKLMDRYENNAQTMEKRICELEAINKELATKNQELICKIQNSMPKE